MFDIDLQINGGLYCCTKPNGSNECPFPHKSPMYGQGTHRGLAMEAVKEFYEGSSTDFYNTFVEVWNKATTLGQGNLIPLTVSCESMPTFDTSNELALQS
jgi:hypothetical protein